MARARAGGPVSVAYIGDSEPTAAGGEPTAARAVASRQRADSGPVAYSGIIPGGRLTLARALVYYSIGRQQADSGRLPPEGSAGQLSGHNRY